MAHIFKLPKDGNKGILVFTHKEMKYFFRPSKPFGKKRPLTYLPFAINLAYTKYQKEPRFVKEFEALRKKYFIGVHFGWHHTEFPELKYADFLMAGKGTVDFTPPAHILEIPMNSRNFISHRFADMNYNEKFWDIICVARAARFKNLDLLLKSIKKLNETEGKFHKVLLIIPPNANENPKQFYTEIIEDYYNWFTEEERNQITIMKLSKDLSLLGMPQNTLIHFYNASKVFTLFSEKEGESRVIAEALLCGLPVVVKSDLEGGGRDFLNPENAVYFDTFETADIAFKTALANYETLRKGTTSLKKDLRDDFTIPILKDYFKKLYQDNQMNFDGELLNLDYLDRRLPAHTHSVPWSINRFTTADIVSVEQFDIFKKYLTEKEIV